MECLGDACKQGCTDDTKCAPGESCASNVCIPNCEDNVDNLGYRDCADNQLCVNDFCVRNNLLCLGEGANKLWLNHLAERVPRQ